MTARRQSKPLQVGSVVIGGDAPIVVQSMANTDTRNVDATIAQIRELQAAGCEIVRLAVPDEKAAEALAPIRRQVDIPLIADIHFKYELALAAIKAGIDGLRLNPGNIRKPEHVKAVVRAAKERGVPIRIGVNSGSLPPGQDGQDDSWPADVPGRMVAAALGHVKILEDLDFDLIKVSLKAFDVPTTIEAYQHIAELIPYPLHLGITEAGTPQAGSVRSAVGIGTLLFLGIGDTIRVSLTGDPVEEVRVAYDILKSLNLRQRGPTMISCPTCGRVEVDLVSLANQVEERLKGIDATIKVAVMGCGVNGPGEARDADVGIASGHGNGAIFRGGQVVRVVPEADLLEELMQEVYTFIKERG